MVFPTVTLWIKNRKTASTACALPKTNMEPENGPLEKEIPIGNHHFQVPAVNFWGVNDVKIQDL